MKPLKVTVIVPSYNRHFDLRKCLEALSKQSRIADQVIVVARNSDPETFRIVEKAKTGWPPSLELAEVTRPGQVAALNRGLDAATRDIIAITDDDTAPGEDWLERIEAAFADPTVDAVGGRDVVYHNGVIQGVDAKVVGKVQWFGRLVGNHRSGVGPCRQVEFLKGANMAFRRSSIRDLRFDERLLGTGAQVHNDLALCLALVKRGGKIVYDPEIRVDHFESPRMDEDQRVAVNYNATAHFNAVFNETLVLLEYLSPLRRVAFILWATLIGTRAQPGLVQLVRNLINRKTDSVARFRSTQSGRREGIRRFRERIPRSSVRGSHYVAVQ